MGLGAAARPSFPKGDVQRLRKRVQCAAAHDVAQARRGVALAQPGRGSGKPDASAAYARPIDATFGRASRGCLQSPGEPGHRPDAPVVRRMDTAVQICLEWQNESDGDRNRTRKH